MTKMLSRSIPPKERFWRRVEKLVSGCWIWRGSRATNGYGQLMIDGKLRQAHRVSYNWAKGTIPPGMQLDHLCRNKQCVNPDHLEIVTSCENGLRGISFAAVNARKTHCPKGHPYDLLNTHYTPAGKRRCRICEEIYWRTQEMRKSKIEKRRAKRLRNEIQIK